MYSVVTSYGRGKLGDSARISKGLHVAIALPHCDPAPGDQDRLRTEDDIDSLNINRADAVPLSSHRYPGGGDP